MEFNPSKCQVVRVTTSKKIINSVYTLHGQILEVVTSTRYLGVDISSGLSWNSHIHVDRITGNANRTQGYIRRNIKTKKPNVRATAYNTFVRPQLEHSSPIWDPHTDDKTLQLEKIQRRAARWTTSTTSWVGDPLLKRSSLSLLQNYPWTCGSTPSIFLEVVTRTTWHLEGLNSMSHWSSPHIECPGTVTQCPFDKVILVQIITNIHSFHWQ